MGRQSWLDLLFAHWPLSAARLRPLVPPELELQEYEGTSWVGVVPFDMRGVMLRGLPDIPGISAFPELNVRLYVEHGGKPGVWFLSLDAAHSLAVWAARTFMHLPYFRADMSSERRGDEVHYRSSRRRGRARFTARYRATGAPFAAAPGSLEHWLTERYCLYAKAPSGKLLRTEIHHWPWPLQPAEATLTDNSMFSPFELELEGAPALLHFARRLDVVAWPPEVCSVPASSRPA